MARPKKPVDELKDQRVPIMMTPNELEAIDEWGFSNRIRSRGEVIRRLCNMAILGDPNVKTVTAIALKSYQKFISTYKDAMDKPDSERLAIYDSFFSREGHEELQVLMEAYQLRGIFDAITKGETYAEALTEVEEIKKHFTEMSQRHRDLKHTEADTDLD